MISFAFGHHRDPSFAPSKKKQLILPVRKIHSRGNETRELDEQVLATDIARTTLYVNYQLMYLLLIHTSEAVNQMHTEGELFRKVVSSLEVIVTFAKSVQYSLVLDERSRYKMA